MVLSFAWYQNVGYPFSFDISLTACWEIEFAHFAGNSTEGSRHFRSPFSNTGILRYLATLFPDTNSKTNKQNGEFLKTVWLCFLLF